MPDERPRIPLSFGGGLDRGTGVFEVDAENMLDLRNWYLYRKRLEARKGIAAVNSFVDDAAADVDDVVLIHPIRGEQAGIVVAYQDGDRELHVYRVAGDGTGTDRVGAWGILPASAHEPPRVLATESYLKVFFAHDEVVFSRRLPTYYYDPFVTPVLVELKADLDGDSIEETLRFRGVTRHLNYVIGWGYGTGAGADESRPEIVRISMPGIPTDWDPEHYFVAGVRDDAVLRCESLGTIPSPLAVFKQTETYQIFGYDRRTFGIRRIDDVYGIAGSRLAVTVNGICYFWTLEGPRVTDGNNPSRDLAWPLDLDAPAPETLVAAGATEDGFAEYLPGRRVILFTFGKRQYTLSIWNPEDPKWSYSVLGYELFCAGRLSSGGTAQSSSAPTTAPSAVSGTGKVGTTDTMTVDFTNNGITDEIVEVWLKPTGGVWALEANPAAAGGTQAIDVEGLAAGVDHAIALRYRRGPFYSPGSGDASDPSLWPAPQQGTGTTLVAAPVLDSTSWDRVDAGNEKNILNWTNTHPTLQTKVFRDAGLIDTLPAGVSTYDDTGAVGETDEVYVLRHVGESNESPDSNSLTQWTGPDVPPVLDLLIDGTLTYHAEWTNGDVSLRTEAWSSLNAASYVLDGTENPGVTSTDRVPAGGVNNDSCDVKVRHKKTEFAVEDFSKYSNIRNVTLTTGA